MSGRGAPGTTAPRGSCRECPSLVGRRPCVGDVASPAEETSGLTPHAVGARGEGRCLWRLPFAACESRAHRKPRLLLRFAGVLLLRDADRRFAASLLFHDPPRITRLPV